MASLRTRLSLLVATGLFVVTAGAALGVMFERWQEDQATLRDDVEIAAVRLAEATDPLPPIIDLPAGTGAYAVVFGAEAEVLGASRPLDDSVIQDLIDNVWALTTSVEELFTVELGDADAPTIVAGTGCLEASVCDTVAVGVSEESFGSYLLRHLLWLLGPALLAGALGALAARWLVARSLLPVDAMRTELDLITHTDLDRRIPVPDSGDEIELLGDSMNATLDRLGRAVSANERFVADAAHELRSPLTGVRAALEVERGGSGQHQLLDDSITELDRAGRLIDDLLLLARRRSGVTRRIDVDLDDVARAAVASLRVRRPELEIETALPPCRVQGDPDDLTRVVTNLLENASRYGNGRIRVSTGHDAAGSATLHVDDDGPGIPPGQEAVVFERFARLDESRARSTGGSGLGLAIVHEIVIDHGGHIAVSTAELGGASFEVHLAAS